MVVLQSEVVSAGIVGGAEKYAKNGAIGPLLTAL
jgi:hypothetical protein